MASGKLHIDLGAIVANWHALDGLTIAKTAAVVKADSYGLSARRVAPALARAGADTFFVATAEEGATLRAALTGAGFPKARIFVFSGHMAGDFALLRDHNLIPLLNSADQFRRHRDEGDLPYGIQLDTGMNRLGMEAADWAALRGEAERGPCQLIMSHLACADEPDHPENPAQLANFHTMTDGTNHPRSLSATGGVLLGEAYHFDLTRPGIGLYGGLPFADATPVVRLSLPVIQVRQVEVDEFVGYGAGYRPDRPRQIATVAAGYADGLIRAMTGKAALYAGDTPCPLAGRVSMDLMGVDVSGLESNVPDHLDILCPAQGVDRLADHAGTIGYEILTSLGARYQRRYQGG
ncbi:alanine racemase [Paracoccaceae bacterium]|nr:alanine racemase [Paracoccaceae bacterium]